MPSCDDVIQRWFIYRFEYELPNGVRHTQEKREEKFFEFLKDFAERHKHTINIERYDVCRTSRPWIEAKSRDWAVIRKFVGRVRRRLKGKAGCYFEEDYEKSI